MANLSFRQCCSQRLIWNLVPKDTSKGTIDGQNILRQRFNLTLSAHGKGSFTIYLPSEISPPLCYSSHITPCWIYRSLHLPGGCHWSRFTFSGLHIPQSRSSVPPLDSPESHCITPCPPLYAPVRIFFCAVTAHCASFTCNNQQGVLFSLIF